MERITKEGIAFIVDNILKEIYLHFLTQDILSKGTNRDFKFWDVKEYDILTDFNHYCNIHDKSFCDEDLKLYHDMLKFKSKDEYNFNCIIKSLTTAIFFLNEK